MLSLAVLWFRVPCDRGARCVRVTCEASGRDGATDRLELRFRLFFALLSFWILLAGRTPTARKYGTDQFQVQGLPVPAHHPIDPQDAMEA